MAERPEMGHLWQQTFTENAHDPLRDGVMHRIYGEIVAEYANVRGPTGRVILRCESVVEHQIGERGKAWVPCRETRTGLGGECVVCGDILQGGPVEDVDLEEIPGRKQDAIRRVVDLERDFHAGLLRAASIMRTRLRKAGEPPAPDKSEANHGS